MRQRWSEVEESAAAARAELERDLERAETVTSAEIAELEAEIAEERRDLDRWLAEARLTAIESREEFEREFADEMASLETTVSSIEQDLEQLSVGKPV